MGIVGSALVAKWSIGLLKQTSSVLLDQQAPEATMHEVKLALDQQSFIVTDLHVWSLAPAKFGVIVAICSQTPITSEAVRSLFDADQFPHVTVEINQVTE